VLILAEAPPWGGLKVLASQSPKAQFSPNGGEKTALAGGSGDADIPAGQRTPDGDR
jgi:hypothetical protein